MSGLDALAISAMLIERDKTRAELISQIAQLDALVKEQNERLAQCSNMRPNARIVELAQRLVQSGPKAAHVSCSETHEISEFIMEAYEAALRFLGENEEK